MPLARRKSSTTLLLAFGEDEDCKYTIFFFFIDLRIFWQELNDSQIDQLGKVVTSCSPARSRNPQEERSLRR